MTKGGLGNLNIIQYYHAVMILSAIMDWCSDLGSNSGDLTSLLEHGENVIPMKDWVMMGKSN